MNSEFKAKSALEAIATRSIEVSRLNIKEYTKYLEAQLDNKNKALMLIVDAVRSIPFKKDGELTQLSLEVEGLAEMGLQGFSLECNSEG